MRRVAFIFSTALMASLLVAALARDKTTYRDALRGFQSASTESDGVNLILNAEGDLPGTSQVSLTREGSKVTGGSWTLTVLPPDADATANEKGRLTGGVTGGTLTFNGDGSLAGADSIQLTIRGGAGQYSRVKSGSAVINLAPQPENPSQLAGTLTLEF
jgi:hypothetical protein